MAAAPVPLEAPSVSPANVRTGVAVSSREFLPAANLANWLAGRGGQIVPAFCYGAHAGAGLGRTLNLAVLPRKQALHRVWVISAYATTSTPFVLTVTRGAYNSGAVTFGTSRVATPATFYETITTPTDVVGTSTFFTLVLSSTATSGPGFIDSISCFEVPRGSLDPALDAGALSLEAFKPGSPINNLSVEAMGEAIVSLRTIARRNGMFVWAVDTADAFTTPSTTYVPIFTLLKPALLAAYTSAANGVIEHVDVNVYAKSTVTNGTFKVATVSGHGNTVTIDSPGSWNWQPGGINTLTFDVDTEDLTAVDGRRSSRWDDLTFELKAGAGGTCAIAAICIGRHKTL